MEGTLAVAGMSFSNVSHQIDNILSKQQLHHTTTTDEVTTYKIEGHATNTTIYSSGHGLEGLLGFGTGGVTPHRPGF